MGAPAAVSDMDCKPLANVKEMECFVIGNKIQFRFAKFENAANAFRWTIQNVRNAGSTKPTLLQEVHTIDAEGYIITAPVEPPLVTNREPAKMTKASLEQSNREHSQPATYTLTFTPVNPMPATGAIVVTYPPQLQLKDKASTKCTVQTSFGSYSSNCKVDLTTRGILITNVFTKNAGYLEPITVILDNVLNPPTNNPAINHGFIIQTYFDSQTIYI